MKRLFIYFALFLFFLIPAMSQINFNYNKRNLKTEHRFDKYLQAIKKENQDIHSVIIVKNGNVLPEKYLRQNEENTPHIMNSVSKAFTSMAVGIAISEKRLKVSDKVVSFFPNDLPLTIIN